MKLDTKLKIVAFIPLFVGMVSLVHALWPISAPFLVLLILGSYLDLKIGKNLPNSILTIIGIAGSLFFILSALRTPFESIAYLIMFLSVIKMLGKKSMRDLKQILGLSFFNFIDSAIFHYSAIFLFYLLIYVISAVVALLVITSTEEKKVLTIEPIIFKKLTRFGMFFGVAVAFFSLFFFVILPRSPYVFMRPQIYSATRRNGFENELQVGGLGDFASKEQILMRVKPLSKAKSRYLYLRGTVYNQYQENTWIRNPEHISGWEYLSQQVSGIKGFQITAEPMRTSVVYSPDYPEKIEIRGLPLTRSWGKVFLITSGEIYRKIQYYSYISNIEDTVFQKTVDFLSVPEEFKNTLDNLIVKISPPEGNIDAKASFIENYFKRNFGYEIINYNGNTWLSEFLKNKKGYCIHFATVVALLLRNDSIPARIVGGFLTDEWNKFGNYYVVKAKHAHTWVEYYNGKSWKKLDPTPPRPFENSTFETLKSYVDYISYLWTTQVLEFSFTHQIKLFTSLRNISISIFKRNLGKLLIALGGFVIAFLLISTLVKKSLQKEHIATKYFKKFERVLIKKGVRLKNGSTVEEIIKSLNDPLATDFLEEYLRCRFSNDCDIEKLIGKFEAFKRKTS
ncbi:MAG: transglutaminaseTgpA domain-containing protein [Candidatus Hydrothermia bacterium]